MKLKDFIKKNGYFLIAEAGCNHEGSLDTAIEMVREASKSGAHAIKFQSFTKDTLFATEEYTKTLGLAPNALDGVDNITFKREWYNPLIEECKKNNIIFMSTPFSLDSVDDMESNNVAIYKIASCDIDNIPLLEKLAKTKKPIIISTGLALNKDIKRALSILKKNEVALLHCSVQYPTPLELARLNRIKVLKNIFKKNIIGYSDHTIGLEAPKVAFTLGAKIIEKHFTITPEKKEGDHIISLSPEEIKALVYCLDGIKDKLGEPDADGRCKPIAVEGQTEDIEVDAVVIAIGTTPNPLISKKVPELQTTKKGTYVVDSETLETSLDGVFAGGDAARGAATVILAVGDGKRAAAGIHKKLSA